MDTVISNSNVMDSNDFFALFADRYGISSSEWIRTNNKVHRGDYISLNTTKKRLAYMLSVPLNTVTDECINIVVVLDESKILGMIKDINNINDGKLVVVDKKDQVVLSSDNLDFLQVFKYSSFKDNAYVQYNNLGGKKVAIANVDSNVENWKYIYIMRTSEYWNQLEKYRKLVFSGILLTLIISCTIAYYLFMKNYEPIKRLLKYLVGYEQSNKNVFNEYNIIQNAIMRSMDERKEFDKLMNFQRKISNDKYLKELLSGNTSEYSSDNYLVDIKFNWDYFLVMGFDIDIDKHFTALSSNPAEAFELLQFIVNNILDELLQKNSNIYTVNIDNTIICLMSFASKDEEVIKKVKEVAIRVQEIVNTYYKISFTIAIGNIYEVRDLIKQSYMETQQLLEFKKIVGGEDILLHTELKDFLFNDNSHKYFYPLQLEEALINSLKSGDFSRICSILEEIFDYNLKNRTLSFNMAQCLKCNIIGILIKNLDSTINSGGEKYHNEITSLEQLIHCENMYEVKEQLLIILKGICDKINSDKKADLQIGEKVILFIKENYKDENLNVSAIAGNFDLHPNYISKLFKLQVGEGLLDYISRIRIEEAKKLIKSEKCNLECIAKMVGYSNCKTFTRAFNKIEGMTPGKYKEMCQCSSIYSTEILV